MNMTAKEFLMAEEISVEERDAYGYTYDEMMPLTQNGALQLYDHAPIFLLYGDDTESQANDRTEILEHDGIFGIEAADWVAIKDKIFAAEGNKMQEDEELQEEMRQWFSNAYEEEDPAKEKPEEKEIRSQYLNILREEDKKENIAMQSLTYASDAFFDEVSMRLSAIKGCYWRSYTDGTGSLRRLHTDTVILEYVLTPADSKYDDEYEDATGWHSFDGSEDFRLALEKIVIEGIVSPMDHGAKDFDVRNDLRLENITEFEKRQSAKRLFVDMDGTLAEFHPVDTMETLYEQGYFAQLAPHENVVNGIKTFMKENPETEVFILSSVLTDSPYAQTEKNEWLDRYLSEIGMENRIFVPCGSAKNEFVPGGVRENDALLDDYSKNLHEWSGKTLKLMNGINGTKGSFQGEKISAEMPVAEFAERLASFCEGKEGSLQAETEKADIENLSYEDKFKIIIETEFPETKGNEELQESLYSHFMDSTQTGFFDEEIRKEFQDMIGAYDKEQNRTFDFMQKLVSEKNSGFYQEEIETGVDFER